MKDIPDPSPALSLVSNAQEGLGVPLGGKEIERQHLGSQDFPGFAFLHLQAAVTQLSP